MSDIYKAYYLDRSTGKRWSIITVIAEDDEDARRRVAEQLDREGRREYYKVWIQDGKIVERHTKGSG